MSIPEIEITISSERRKDFNGRVLGSNLVTDNFITINGTTVFKVRGRNHELAFLEVKKFLETSVQWNLPDSDVSKSEILNSTSDEYQFDKTAPDDLLVRFFGFCGNGYSYSEVTQNQHRAFVEKHIKILKENYVVNDLEDLRLIFNPTRLVIGKKYLKFTSRITNNGLLTKLAKKDQADFYLKLHLAINYKELEISENTLIEEVDVSLLEKLENDSVIKSLTNTPCSTKKYQDYLKTISVKDYFILNSNPPNLKTADEAIKESKNTLKNFGNKPESQVKNLNDAWHNFISKSYDLLEDEPSTILCWYEDYLASRKRIDTMKFIKNYCEISVTFKDIKECEAFHNMFIKSGRKGWCSTPNSTEFVINLLLNKTSVNSTFEVIKEVFYDERSVTAKQWKEFAENYETYKDMPASWWITLIAERVK